MEWTKRHHLSPLFVQAHVLADQVNDIVGLLNLIDYGYIKPDCHVFLQIP
jgi:hypothetical protein